MSLKYVVACYISFCIYLIIFFYLSSYQFAVEGDSVTLSCSYTGSVRGLHWYHQYTGSPPKFLILDYYETVTEADPPVAGVSIHHRKDNNSKEKKQVNLTISSAEVTDSAVYYCALRPTVIESPETLYKNPDFSLMILYSAVKTFCVCVCY
uniref:T-cell receptor alpha/delta variable 24.0.4 n=1 Tax=Cyprinus carpio carpio TaxID=630221 RepID=A0A9J8DAP2_CYPCA